MRTAASHAGLFPLINSLWRLLLPSRAWARVLDLAGSPSDVAAIVASCVALTLVASAVWWSSLSRLKRVMQGC